MKIENEKISKKEWNDFLIENNGSFLQSFEWGEFQESLSKKVWRFLIKDKGEIYCIAQIIKETFPLSKSIFYLPFGPCFKEDLFLKGKKKCLSLILRELSKLSKKENAIFLKIESWGFLPKIENSFSSLKRIQPQKTLILNLKKNLDEILKEMHQKTRYNIRLAQKKGVSVEKISFGDQRFEKEFENFWKLLQKTAKRNKFKPYRKSYLKKLLKFLPSKLFVAKWQGKTIASNIVVFFGKRVTYLHGASDYKFRHLMAPHLLQWEQIKEAKEKGFLEYDFWGIDEKKWPGLTRFKKGFGGEEREYEKGIDIPFQKNWYLLYRVLKKTIF
mgnify:CR=1 FL=1